MKEKGFNEGQNHSKIYRPWGCFLKIEKGDTWQIKKNEVNPGASLSLQMHFHRSEHWVIVEGTAKIQIDDTEKIIGSNESVYIPLGVKHRLSNPTIDGKEISWEEGLKIFSQKIKDSDGKIIYLGRPSLGSDRKFIEDWFNTIGGGEKITFQLLDGAFVYTIFVDVIIFV
mgnify:CR=1 FL=1